MTTWFTADLHFGHANILKHHPTRGADMDDMHGRLVSNWNQSVKQGDDVFVLGDFFLGRQSDDVGASGWFHALRGRKHLIVGNHDSGPTLRLPWSSINHLREWKQKPHRAVLCHYPLLTWNGAHHGVWMLHGHSHGLLRAQATTRMDVGVDTHPEFRPYHLDEVVELMAQRAYVPVDGHEVMEVTAWSDAVGDDIVERLRHAALESDEALSVYVCFDAADEIERLRAEITEWRRTVRAQEALAAALRAVVAEKYAEIERLRAAGPARDEAAA